MTINYSQLKIDDAAGHPVTGAFNADTALAAGEWNALNRVGQGGIDGMVSYLATHKNKTDEGGDTTGSAMLGRLEHVALSEVGDDPFFRGGLWEAGGSGTNEQIALSAAGNTVTFGSAHDISSMNAKDPIRLWGTTADDGFQHIVSIAGQVVTVTSITVTETLERIAKVSLIKGADTITLTQKHAAESFIRMFMNSQISTVNFQNTEIDIFYTELINAGVWKTADVDALKALSTISYATEKGYPVLEAVDISTARAL